MIGFVTFKNGKTLRPREPKYIKEPQFFILVESKGLAYFDFAAIFAAKNNKRCNHSAAKVLYPC